MLALSIFTCSHPHTIVDELELNFCVRDGNRWTLKPINTNLFIAPCGANMIIARFPKKSIVIFGFSKNYFRLSEIAFLSFRLLPMESFGI